MDRRILLALALIWSASLPAAAQSDEPTPIRVALEQREDGVITTSFDVSGSFTETFRKRLAGGLRSRAVIEMVLVDLEEEPIELRLRECELRLDIWDDVLLVRIREADRRRGLRFLLIDEALAACGVVKDTSLVEATRLSRGRRYRLMIRVSLNPVSEELLRNTREFLANPRGAQPGRPRTFLGAVARLFSSDSSAGGEQFVFLSQVLSRPERG